MVSADSASVRLLAILQPEQCLVTEACLLIWMKILARVEDRR